MSATYIPGSGTWVTVQGTHEGLTVLLSPYMTVAAIEAYMRDLRAWLE